MKKFYRILTPIFPIILGALLLLLYVNNFAAGGGVNITFGIIGLLVAIFYLSAGIVPLLLGNKLPVALARVFEIGVVILYPALLFAGSLTLMIQNADNLRVNAWIIEILSLVSCLGFVLLYCIAVGFRKSSLNPFVQIFGLTVILALVLDLIFTSTGAVIAIGDLALVTLITYSCYVAILLPALLKMVEVVEDAPKQEAPEEAEAPAEEEAPAEPEEEPEGKQEEEAQEEKPSKKKKEKPQAQVQIDPVDEEK